MLNSNINNHNKSIRTLHTQDGKLCKPAGGSQDKLVFTSNQEHSSEQFTRNNDIYDKFSKQSFNFSYDLKNRIENTDLAPVLSP